MRSWNEHAIKVKDGNLVITFSKVGEKLMCGGITTEGKFEQSHGLFEIRFKVDEISGMWYAFWLMDNNNNDAHIDGSASDAAEKITLRRLSTTTVTQKVILCIFPSVLLM